MVLFYQISRPLERGKQSFFKEKAVEYKNWQIPNHFPDML